MTAAELLQMVLLTAAGTVDAWRPAAIGGLLLVVAAACFVIAWLVLPEPSAS